MLTSPSLHPVDRQGAEIDLQRLRGPSSVSVRNKRRTDESNEVQVYHLNVSVHSL